MGEYILEMKNIVKEFPGVRALDNVNLKVKKGTIHALCGENGAGKSTLMKVLSGIYPFGTYDGDIVFNGEVCKFSDIKDSERHGIAIIHQELATIPNLSIAENIFLGNEREVHGIIDWEKTGSDAREIMQKVGLYEEPTGKISDLSVGKQQLCEIAKALKKDAKLLILDEPTASLNENDSENLLNLLLELKSRGITSIVISHKLNEIERVADEITVIRDGSTIETLERDKDEIKEDRIIKGMVGREINDRFPKREHKVGDIAFEIRNWTVEDPMVSGRTRLDNVNLKVYKGEVVGIAGLMGAGRTELAMSIFGRLFGNKISGEMLKDGKVISISNVKDAIRHKIAYVTEDRKGAGLILDEDIRRNITLANMKKVSRTGVIDADLENMVGEEYKKKLGIKCSSIFQTTGNLSGGNQQKVVLGKWILTEPDVLILDEPTRGIDVGAKYEIYTIINALVAEGKSVIMISSELPEVLGVSDRVYVMNEGKIVGELKGAEATPEGVMSAIIKNRRL
ncbi:MAG: ATP-binding cassette domain-containing protein [Clostridia bacterium]|nr:ATP-binding cassette domain-containing protein [Clostridia bacterium]